MKWYFEEINNKAVEASDYMDEQLRKILSIHTMTGIEVGYYAAFLIPWFAWKLCIWIRYLTQNKMYICGIQCDIKTQAW